MCAGKTQVICKVQPFLTNAAKWLAKSVDVLKLLLQTGKTRLSEIAGGRSLRVTAKVVNTKGIVET